MNNLSRRDFLAAAGLGASGLLLHPAALSAADSSLPELKLLLVSDTHLGYRDKEPAAQQWEKTAAELSRAAGDLILHLGDVVDGGREAQYPIYLETRKKIDKPVHEIPGNHDPAELFAKHVRREIDAVVDHQWLRMVMLGNARPESHDGFISPEQITLLDEACRDAGEHRYVIVAMHVPAHTNRHPDRGWYVKPDNGQKELYETLDRHRAKIVALFHGHFHNGIRGWDDHAGLHEICFPSALYNLDRHLEEQKAAGYNPSEFRPGYTVATLSLGKLHLQYKPVGEAASVEKSLRTS